MDGYHVIGVSGQSSKYNCIRAYCLYFMYVLPKVVPLMSSWLTKNMELNADVFDVEPSLRLFHLCRPVAVINSVL